MESWPCSIFMLRAHIYRSYLSSWTFAARCVTSSRASKGPLRCRRWTFGFFRLSCHDLVYACLCWMSASCSRQQSYVLKNCAYTCAFFCVSCPSPCQASFRPLPLALKWYKCWPAQWPSVLHLFVFFLDEADAARLRLHFAVHVLEPGLGTAEQVQQSSWSIAYMLVCLNLKMGYPPESFRIHWLITTLIHYIHLYSMIIHDPD